MGIFDGLKNLFRRRKDDKRNEAKVVKTKVSELNISKPKPAVPKRPEWVRKRRRQYCRGSIIPPALRPTVAKEELERTKPTWYKRQLKLEALAKAFPGKPEAPVATPQRRKAIQEAFGK